MAAKILLDADTTMTCPDCGTDFPLHRGIAGTAIEEFRRAYVDQLGEERKELRAAVEAEVERKAKSEVAAVTEELEERLATARAAAKRAEEGQQQAVQKALEDSAEQASRAQQALEAKLARREQSMKEFEQREMKLLEEKEQLEEQKQQFSLKVRQAVAEERTRFQEKANEEFSLREAEYRKKIADAQRANDDLRRKLEQGSQQLQGEVLELQLEDVLRSGFPFDEVTEVRKGARGADVIQAVRTRAGQNCGSVIWEAKRAENWSAKWITKLKDDQHEAGANIAVLVSSVFPDGQVEPFVLHEGVWVARPDAVRPLAEALRTVLLESARRDAIVAGRHEKAEALYDYLCSHVFAQRVRGIVDAYVAMQEDLAKEKAAMQRLWKKREQQIERITGQTMGMCGELQGIAQDSMPQISGIGELAAEEISSR